jgi:hypothetical protein
MFPSPIVDCGGAGWRRRPSRNGSRDRFRPDVCGFLILLLSLSGNLALVLGFAFGSGIANMVFVIPSQTLFQERTPPELMGRVVAFRFAPAGKLGRGLKLCQSAQGSNDEDDRTQ